MPEPNETTILPVEAEEKPAVTAITAGNTGNFIADFRRCYSMAKTLCMAEIIPEAYRGKPADTAVAIDMAGRMNVSPIMVMQNLYVVKGKPSWSGQACMSFLRTRYKAVKVIYTGDKGTDGRGCYIKVRDADGDTIEGAEVTIGMAKREGWYNKSGSKWQTMPELMLAYRAAAFFARVHCPDVLMGCSVEGEAEDTAPREVEDVL